MTKICVTGGIGCGKSVVCRICITRGIPVYDCDSRAKDLMQRDPELRALLIDEIGAGVFNNEGKLNRKLVSDRIFSDDEKRRVIEREVHAAVRRDITSWLDEVETGSEVALIETAIPGKSLIDKMADRIWLVEAPFETRIKRVMARSAMSREQVLSRMAAQCVEFEGLPKDKTFIVDNSGLTPLLLQIDNLLLCTS